MKKIVSAVAAGALLAGAAFAEFTVTGNARVYSDLFSYTAKSRADQAADSNGKGTDDTGAVKLATDTKHADDITIQAKGEKSGIKITLETAAAVNGSSATNILASSYRLWTTIGKIQLDAGAYDQRLAKNLNADGNWKDGRANNGNKPGIWGSTALGNYGKDAANITAINNGKKYTNFQVSSKVNDNLTVRGVLFLTEAGTDVNGTSKTHDEKWIFTPFAVGAEYALDKDTKINFNAKLSSITHGSYTAASTPASTKTSYELGTGEEITASDTKTYTSLTDGTSYSAKFDSVAGELYQVTTTTVASSNTESYTADKSIWTLNANAYKKLSDALEIEAHYTLGMILYSNWSGYGAHYLASDGDHAGRLVRDDDVFAHGFDFRLVDKLSDKLTLTSLTGINYTQGTATQKSKNRNTISTYFKDTRAKSYYTDAAGQLAYYTGISLDYKQSDIVTLQLQTGIQDSNLFSAELVGTSYHVDYLSGLVWRIRPAVLVNPDKSSQFFAGAEFALSGFKTNATGKNNTFKTDVSIPIGLRVKL